MRTLDPLQQVTNTLFLVLTWLWIAVGIGYGFKFLINLF